MALNGSGPISFGGATVGQSINLELGVSGTATASINSTPFRSLAGVPSGQISLSNFYGKSNFPGGSTIFGPGTWTWIPPSGISSVSLVAVGGGGGASQSNAGGGGGLGYKNNYAVTAGCSYTVVVGFGGRGSTLCGGQANPGSGGCTYFVSTAVVKGGGGVGSNSCGQAGGTYVGDGGGNGGAGAKGGGGAGGYAGTGGRGTTSGCCPPTAGAGGGGGGGNNSGGVRGAGGGVGLYGQGSNGAAGTGCPGNSGGKGGSGGANGSCYYGDGSGGLYGGGGAPRAIYYPSVATQKGGSGGLRIVWPGSSRTFPSTNVCASNDTYGSVMYSDPGTYSFTVPAGVTSISFVAVGAGYMVGGITAGGAGALGYKNNLSVTPGDTYSVRVARRSSGQTTYLNKSGIFYTAGSANGTSGATVRSNMDGGGNGGAGGSCGCGGGGGGAGGYSGNGGEGRGYGGSPAGTAGSGGGGGGGGRVPCDRQGGGGGVGLFGEGASGALGGYGGSGGGTATYANGPSMGGNAGGGGGTGNGQGACSYVNRGHGAIRIVWPGACRQFPSTCVHF